MADYYTLTDMGITQKWADRSGLNKRLDKMAEIKREERNWVPIITCSEEEYKEHMKVYKPISIRESILTPTEEVTWINGVPCVRK